MRPPGRAAMSCGSRSGAVAEREGATVRRARARWASVWGRRRAGWVLRAPSPRGSRGCGPRRRGVSRSWWQPAFRRDASQHHQRARAGRAQTGSAGRSPSAHRRGGAGSLLECHVAESARAAAVVCDEGVGDLSVHLKGLLQHLMHAGGGAGKCQRGRWFLKGLASQRGRSGGTLPLTDHGRLEQKSCVLEKGRS